jgi:alkanesulfonate monooxygenase SsuD/methylene tetrahydromethanopterin reductase-like flavin-dependent oxidoreductase (luciferase family)
MALSGSKQTRMDVGMQLTFCRYGWSDIRDGQVVDEELRLARLAEDLGFDVIWSVEHHFFDYSFCPDNTELLAYVAGVTKTIDVGTAAVILPWNEPLRVAEKVSLLDHLAGGRLRFGIGRGLSRREFAAFRGVEMSESRERFDEAAAMILAALETGEIEGQGPFYPQPRIPIRPRPARSFRDRLYAVASSDDSVEAAARFRARMVMFADRPWASRMPAIERHRALYRELHGEMAPPPLTCDFTYCDADAGRARERATRYLGTYLASVLEHYEVLGAHFTETKGYEAYARASEVLRGAGAAAPDHFLKSFLKAVAFGTPDEIIAALAARRELMGSFELSTCFRFGGIPYEQAEASMRFFAAEVLPELKRWT